LGEAKWKSSVGTAQGKKILQKYAAKLYPGVTQFFVLGVGLHNDVAENYCDGF
jgi:hypothetical protein